MWEETKYTAELTVLLHLIANTEAVIDPFAGHLCTAFSCCLIHHSSPHTTLRPSKGFLVVLACCCCSSALMRFLWWSGWFTLTCDNSRYFFFVCLFIRCHYTLFKAAVSWIWLAPFMLYYLFSQHFLRRISCFLIYIVNLFLLMRVSVMR